jgi:chromosome segregation ATPase
MSLDTAVTNVAPRAAKRVPKAGPSAAEIKAKAKAADKAAKEKAKAAAAAEKAKAAAAAKKAQIADVKANLSTLKLGLKEASEQLSQARKVHNSAYGAVQVAQAKLAKLQGKDKAA